MLRILLTYGLLLFVTTVAAQSFGSNFRIENITFPEGNQLAYVYDMAQDTTGLLWFRSGPSFYIYDGHDLSKVGPDALGIPLLDIGSTKFYGDKTQPYFYIPGDSLIVYDPAAREIVRVIDPIPEKLGAWPKPQVINYVGVSEDGALWGLAHKENFEDALVVRWNGSGAFRTVDTIDLSWGRNSSLYPPHDICWLPY